MGRVGLEPTTKFEFTPTLKPANYEAEVAECRMRPDMIDLNNLYFACGAYRI